MSEKEPSAFSQSEQSPQGNALEILRSRGSLGQELEMLGVVLAERFPAPSRNEVFVGTNSEGKRFHIKLYTEIPGGEGLQGRTDIACYEHLGDKLPLPRLFAASEKDGYIVTEFLQLQDIEQTKQGVADVVDTIETKLATVDAPFLPGMKMEYYDGKLLRKVRELGEEGVVTSKAIATAIQIFRSKRDEIARRPLVFSHQDLKFENVKRDEAGSIIIIDPEFARRDIPEYDAAALLADLEVHPELAEYARQCFSAGTHINAELLDAIELRRCVEMLRGSKMRHLPHNENFKKHLFAFEQIVSRY